MYFQESIFVILELQIFKIFCTEKQSVHSISMNTINFFNRTVNFLSINDSLLQLRDMIDPFKNNKDNTKEYNTIPFKNIDQSYKNLSFLGQGGFGTVYKSTNIKSGKIVAIKLVEHSEQSFNYLLDEIFIMKHISWYPKCNPLILVT